MTWTYSGDPSASELDELRFLLGDTDTTDQQLSDEEILYLLQEHGDSVVTSAMAACRRLIAKYSRCIDIKTGDIDLKYSQRVSHLNLLMQTLREGLRPVPYAGGISKADIEAVQDDDDRQAPNFAIGMMDNPATEPDNFGGAGGTGGVI